MWDWLRLRRRSNRTRFSPPNQDESTTEFRRGEGINRLLRSTNERPMLFTPRPVIACFPPKCIGRLSYSQILYGERLEDFSSDCWLENHLHRFGFPEANEAELEDDIHTPFEEESADDDTTGSDTTSSGYTDYAEELSDDDFNNSVNVIQPRRRLALEELFIPLDGGGHVESMTDDPEEDRPPPYSQFDDPPPTYEEAVGVYERRSRGSVSSFSSAFMW